MNPIEGKVSSGQMLVHEFGITVGPHPLAMGAHLLALLKKYHTPRRERVPSPSSSLTPNIYLIRPKSTLARARALMHRELKAGLTLESFDGHEHS